MTKFKWWMYPLIPFIVPMVIVGLVLFIVIVPPLWIITYFCLTVFCNIFNIEEPKWLNEFGDTMVREDNC